MQVMILSPHRDDAAFSCGLLLEALLQAGCSVRVANVFTVSSYAPYLDESASDRTQQVTESRRLEDLRFVQTLCAHAGVPDERVELLDLGWLDLPLRWQTEDGAAIAPAPLQAQEIEKLQNAFTLLPHADLVFAPGAVGGHIDHRLVRRAAEQVFHAPSLVFYEDLPYACSLSAPLPHGDTLTDMWLPGIPVAASLKRELCLCYPSQIDPALAELMDQYGQQHGGERYWARPDALQTLQAAHHVLGEGA